MPWTSTSVNDQRINFVVRASQDSINMSALCREFGISRPTGYLWLNRYREVGRLSGVFEHSRRPRNDIRTYKYPTTSVVIPMASFFSRYMGLIIREEYA